MERFKDPKEETNTHCTICGYYIWVRQSIHGIYDGCRNEVFNAKPDQPPESIWILKDETYEAICYKCFINNKHVGKTSDP